MHLLRQIPQNYVLERRFFVPSRADFTRQHGRRKTLDTLVRTFNVTDSWGGDKNTHRYASRTDRLFMSEPFATQGTEILAAVFTGHLAIPLLMHSEFPIRPRGSGMWHMNTTFFPDHEEITRFKGTWHLEEKRRWWGPCDGVQEDKWGLFIKEGRDKYGDQGELLLWSIEES